MAIVRQEKKITISGYGLEIIESNEKEEGCGICGGKQIYIRGRHPEDDRRLVCPTCVTERLEQILDLANPNYGKSYQEKETEENKHLC